MDNEEEKGGAVNTYRAVDLTEEKGPLCGKILGDLGIDVIKVESPGGDPSRNLGPFYHDVRNPERSLSWFAFNTSKRGITLNIETEDGKEALRRLVANSDIIIESFAPGYMKSLGLGYSALSQINPRVIMTSITGFGQTGPYKDFKAPDIVCWAMGGGANLTGDPSRSPLQIGIPQAYLMAGVEAAIGCLIALWHREVTGEGQYVDVSAQESVTLALFNTQHQWDIERINLRRDGIFQGTDQNRHRVVYPCRDGHIFYLLSGVKGQRALVEWMHSEGMADDFLRQFDWADFTQDKRARDLWQQLEARFAKFFATKTKAELWKQAVAKEIYLAPINTIKEAVKFPQFQARKYWQTVEHPEMNTTIIYPGAPYVSRVTPCKIRRRPPFIGEHNDKILHGELGPTRENAKVLKGVGETVNHALKGIKVADFSWIVTGPMAARYLADHGATVVRVETKHHIDGLRFIGPFKDGIRGIDQSAFWATCNAGKYGITLDLRKSEARDVAKRLTKWADILLESFTPGTMKKWDLDYDSVSRINPTIIYASSCQLGQTGPLAHWAGRGGHAAAIAGFDEITGYPGSELSLAPGAYADIVAYRYLVIAIMAALLHRHRTGEGQYIDQSQAESVMQFLTPAVLHYTANNKIMKRIGNFQPNSAPHGIFTCAGEDRWCAIAVDTDEDWRAFCRAIGSPPWTQDRRFATFMGRKENEEELYSKVTEWTSSKPAEQVMNLMQEASVAAGVVEKAEDLHRDPQLNKRHHFWLLDHPVIGPHAYDAPAFKLSKTPAELRMPGPYLGQHNEYVYKRILGMSNEEYSELQAKGIFE